MFCLVGVVIDTGVPFTGQARLFYDNLFWDMAAFGNSKSVIFSNQRDERTQKFIKKENNLNYLRSLQCFYVPLCNIYL